MKQHEWFKYKMNNNHVYDCCKNCGILKNTKNGEKECKGKVKVETRGLKI